MVKSNKKIKLFTTKDKKIKSSDIKDLFNFLNEYDESPMYNNENSEEEDKDEDEESLAYIWSLLTKIGFEREILLQNGNTFLNELVQFRKESCHDHLTEFADYIFSQLDKMIKLKEIKIVWDLITTKKEKSSGEKVKSDFFSRDEFENLLIEIDEHVNEEILNELLGQKDLYINKKYFWDDFLQLMIKFYF